MQIDKRADRIIKQRYNLRVDDKKHLKYLRNTFEYVFLVLYVRMGDGFKEVKKSVKNIINFCKK